ncbi:MULTISPECIES: CPXCG motif-containing cysteine-rich protein [unclassified Thioalkalivibrio]|uniref:CPXCG motif-containing cysteine-rich protein n=1 Tax=unclassified Thioalkalivibrio TaxID=2621013 RepID=UPI0003719B2C|nr:MULTISPECIES: CPXCG motif-containing cysteine-rich protein [unclassified Thioalkalivibrio]
MTRPIEFVAFACPWCGEPGETTVDVMSDEDEWVEDCGVCCSPIVFRHLTTTEDDIPVVDAQREGG